MQRSSAWGSSFVRKKPILFHSDRQRWQMWNSSSAFRKFAPICVAATSVYFMQLPVAPDSNGCDPAIPADWTLALSPMKNFTRTSSFRAEANEITQKPIAFARGLQGFAANQVSWFSFVHPQVITPVTRTQARPVDPWWTRVAFCQCSLILDRVVGFVCHRISYCSAVTPF